MIFCLPGNDQRRARFVDQDRIDFVDNGVGQFALYALRRRIDHVVTQVVEAEFVVRAVGNVAGESRLFAGMVHLRQVDADAQAEETMQLPHPFGVTISQVVINCDDMHAVTSQRIEVGRQRRDQGLALAGTHFGDFAVMQHHAADQLHVEMTHPQGPLAGLTHHCEGFGQQGVKRLAGRHARLEFIGLGTQRLVRQRANARFQRIDLTDGCRILANQPIVAAAENLFEETGNHRELFT